MLFVAVVLGLLGTMLILLGRWGVRGRDRLSVVVGWDQRSIDRRRATLGRGAYTCMAVGVLFLILAVTALVYRPGDVSCPPAPGPCTGECALIHHCPSSAPAR